MLFLLLSYRASKTCKTDRSRNRRSARKACTTIRHRAVQCTQSTRFRLGIAAAVGKGGQVVVSKTRFGPTRRDAHGCFSIDEYTQTCRDESVTASVRLKRNARPRRLQISPRAHRRLTRSRHAKEPIVYFSPTAQYPPVPVLSLDGRKKIV